MEKDPVDLSCLRDYTDGDPEAIEELLEIFHETFTEELDNLKKNIMDGECKSWSEISHKLKGAAGYVGAEDLRTLCAKGQDMTVATSEERSVLYDEIESNYATVREFLEARAA